MENEIDFEFKSCVFFDLCDTLYYSNTTFDFLEHFFSNNNQYIFFNLFRKTILFKIINKLIIVLFKYDLTRATAIKFLKNKTEEEIQLTLNLFLANLDEKKIMIIHTLLKKAKSSDCEVILISASLDFIVEKVASKLQINNYEATILERKGKDNVFTGKIKKDLLGHKNHILKKYINKKRKTYFITDNISDYNCINLIDNFIAVSYPNSSSFWKKQNNLCKIYEV